MHSIDQFVFSKHGIKQTSGFHVINFSTNPTGMGIDGIHGFCLWKFVLSVITDKTNFKMDAQSPMSLILVGQNELWERLQLQSCAAIRQRIDLQCKLNHYDRSQVGAYMARHLTYARVTRDLFTEGAIDEIHRFSSGAARMVNKIATHCLIYGAMNKHRILDDHLVKRVIAGELS
jgi:hypothetical protein